MTGPCLDRSPRGTILSSTHRTPSRASVPRWIVTLLAAAVALATGTSSALAVTPAEDPNASAIAFLADGYTDHPDSFGFGIGSTTDLIYALAGAGVGSELATRALADLEAGADSYLTDTGPLAKTLIAVDVAGGDISAFAGRDLEQELRAAMGEDGAFHAYAVNQAYAVLALARTADGVPAEALDWLATQRCDDGSIGNDFDEDGAPDCPGDADTTALAAQAFAAGARDAELATSVDWLLANQAEDGSFSNFGANPNSTGVAAQALRSVGETDAADAAAAWITTQQIACGQENAGGIASPYDGLPSLEFATLQGVLAFGAASLDRLDLAGADADAPTLTCAAAPDDGASEPAPAPTEDGTTAPDAEEPAEEEELPATGSELTLAILAGALLVAGAGMLRLSDRAG